MTFVLERCRLYAPWLLAALLIAPGCADQKKKSTQADPRIEQSFGVKAQAQPQTSDLSSPDRKQIVIKKEALDKEFLLQASLMRQVPMPTASGLKSRIVAFKRVNDTVFLMEATQGHVITKDLPSQLILTRMPILSETASDLTLDFSEGMSALFVSGDWYSSDLDEGSYTKTFQSVEARVSFIEDASFVDNALVIRQIAQLRGAQLDSVEVKYYLEPYQPNPNFKKKAAESIQKFGFFEVAPQYTGDGGSLEVYASKFDQTKPIVFAVSANTPPEYQAAVRDGILYWNRAFKNDPIQVVTAPEGVTAPDYNYNVVQWVPWDAAGYAYADAQMDPRTGEIRHAQVFMTSTFAVSGESRARQLLKKGPQKQSAAQDALSLAGMIQVPLCNRQLEDRFYEQLEDMVSRQAPDSEYLRISQDYIREVVAHEVGHTLGLRHNFAGSLEMSYTLDQRETILQDYIQNQKVADHVVPSSSVMEYQVFEEAAMSGHLMAKSDRILPYDQKVIQALYEDQSFDLEEVPLFCTDSQTNLLDCQTFDLGSNPIEFLKWSQQSDTKRLSQSLFSTILNAKLVERDPQFVASTWVNRLLGSRYKAFSLMSSETPLIRVRRSFTSFDDFSKLEVKAQEEELFRQAYETAGGWPALLALPSLTELRTVPTEVRRLMSVYQSQVGDKILRFNLEEQVRLEKQLTRFMPELEKSLQLAQWKAIGDVKNAASKEFSEDFVQWIEAEARRALVGQDGVMEARKQREDGSWETITLPKFVAAPELRKQVATSLKTLTAEDSWRLTRLKQSLRFELQKLAKVYLADVDTIEYRVLDEEASRWLGDYRAMIRDLSL